MARGSRAPRRYGRYNLYDREGNRALTISERAADRMQAEGSAQLLCRFCKRGELEVRSNVCKEGRQHDMALHERVPVLAASDATIRMREMLANAGLHDKQSVVEAAREKVRQWGEIQHAIFDELTITVPA